MKQSSEMPIEVGLYCMFLFKQNVLLLDFFEDECTEGAAEECSAFRAEVPLSKHFNSTVFTQYCR